MDEKEDEIRVVAEEQPPIDEIVLAEESRIERLRQKVDRGSAIAYSLTVGTGLHYMAGGTHWQVLVGRTTATIVNYFAQAKYGELKNQMFIKTNTTKDSSQRRKYWVGLGVFNMVQPVIMGTSVALGDLIIEGDVDWRKVGLSVLELVLFSPAVAPTMNWTMKQGRRLFGVPSADEVAYDVNYAENTSTQDYTEKS